MVATHFEVASALIQSKTLVNDLSTLPKLVADLGKYLGDLAHCVTKLPN